MEERRVGEGEPPFRPPYRSFSGCLLVLRVCQKSRGEVAFSSGDDWNGDESVVFRPRPIFLFVWFQLGELRLFSVVDISESGRGWPSFLVGVGGAPFLEMRSGCVIGSSEAIFLY